MSLLSPSQGIRRWPSLTSYFQRGTSPLTVWYAGLQNQTAFATTTFGLGTLLAYPFELSRRVVISKISFEVTAGGGAGAVGRVGLYRSTSLVNPYPSSLVLDGGEFDCTTIAVKTTSGLSISLEAGVYWAAWLIGVASATFRRVTLPQITHTLGSDNTLNSLKSSLTVAVAYGPLPATFTAGAALSNSNAIMTTALEFSS